MKCNWEKDTLSSKKSKYQVHIFGGTLEKKDYSGFINFFDALITPDAKTWFTQDIITTHYQKYYSGNRLPDGTENPIPIKIAALKPEIKFLVVLQGLQPIQS